MPAIPAVAAVATAGATVYSAVKGSKEAKKAREQQKELLKKEAENNEITIPPRQNEPEQDISWLLKDLQKTVLNTYYDIQDIKTQSRPVERVIEAKQDYKVYIYGLIVLILILFFKRESLKW